MPRRPLYQRDAPEGTPFQPRPMRGGVLSGISPSFEKLSRTGRQVVYVLLTRAPLYSPPERGFLVRLACVKHAASVRSEPGSNSCVQSICAVGPHAPRSKPGHAKAQPKLNLGSVSTQTAADDRPELRRGLADSLVKDPTAPAVQTNHRTHPRTRVLLFLPPTPPSVKEYISGVTRQAQKIPGHEKRPDSKMLTSRVMCQWKRGSGSLALVDADEDGL